MKKDSEGTIQANIEIAKQLEDGKVPFVNHGQNDAERANIEMQRRFRGGDEQPAEGVSPAFVYTPAMDLNPEDDR